jgi:ADP-heptose:LPS heptosyltransferase
MTIFRHLLLIIETCLGHLVRITSLVYIPLRTESSLTYIVRSTSLGDFIVLVPFVASVIKKSKNVRILIISRTGDVGSMILPHWKDRITLIDPQDFFLKSQLRNPDLNELSKESPGQIFFAPQSIVNSFLSLKYLVATRIFLGFKSPIKGFSIDPRFRSHIEYQIRADLLFNVNVGLAPFIACQIDPYIDRQDCQKLLAITDEENREVDLALASLGVSSLSNPGIAFYVHAKDERKCWPLQRFISVAKEVLRDYDQNIVLIGGPEDREYSETVARELPANRAIVVAGSLSVRGTLALLSRCNLFVGNDGSPTHMAALQGCRCVTIFCNFEMAGTWEPITSPASISLRPVLNTERRKGDFGISLIPVEAVLHAVKYFINETSVEPIHYVRYYNSESCVLEKVISERILVD